MSRINRAPVAPGAPIDAADLNTRFNDFTQTDINAANLRDGAIDLPQLDSTPFVMINSADTNLGFLDLLHAAPRVVASYGGATSPTPTPVADAAGTPPDLALGGAGWTIRDNEDVLRIYWDLSVNPTFTGTPWTGVGSISQITLPLPTVAASSMSCWLAWVQWDITSNALVNWVEPTNQGAFATNFTGAKYGSSLPLTRATTAIPAWLQRVDLGADGALGAGTLVNRRTGWRGVSGTFYIAPTAGDITIYGLRIVLAGIAHPWKSGGINYLAWDPVLAGGGQTLEYTGGKITALHQRIK